MKRLSGQAADAELQTMVIEQIYESALLVEGLHPDPSSMAPRIQKLIEAVVERAACF